MQFPTHTCINYYYQAACRRNFLTLSTLLYCIMPSELLVSHFHRRRMILWGRSLANQKRCSFHTISLTTDWILCVLGGECCMNILAMHGDSLFWAKKTDVDLTHYAMTSALIAGSKVVVATVRQGKKGYHFPHNVLEVVLALYRAGPTSKLQVVR